ncbi:MAG: hypothetical protein ACFB13_04200 [Kiloniellaceae bacterium]
MPIIFPTIDRAKKAAKALASVSDAIPLNVAQHAVARIAGCRDWHDLETRLKHRGVAQTTGAPVSSDLDLQGIADLALQVADELETDWSTALYAISIARLPGLCLESLADYEQIWLRLMIWMCGFSGQRKAPGCIVKMKADGRMGQLGYLRAYGRPTYVVTDVSVETCVADFQVSFPRNSVAPFVPARLKYAYGFWSENDGAKVLFSRDYKPLWRLREGRRPERLDPWLWIDKTDEQHFWDSANPPWYTKKRREEEGARLQELGITALPKLTDVLPGVILNPELHNVGDAVDAMAKREDLELTETFHGVLQIPKIFVYRSPG